MSLTLPLFCLSRYLHEVCQPPIVHRNFKSANLLLDDDLSMRVSDCGLAPLISSGSVSQVSHISTFFLQVFFSLQQRGS